MYYAKVTRGSILVICKKIAGYVASFNTNMVSGFKQYLPSPVAKIVLKT